MFLKDSLSLAWSSLLSLGCLNSPPQAWNSLVRLGQLKSHAQESACLYLPGSSADLTDL